MQKTSAILLCAPDAATGADPLVQDLCNGLAAQDGVSVEVAGFGGTPDIAAGLAALAGRGASQIVCLPLQPFIADSMKTALPIEIKAFAAQNPGVDVVLGPDLGIDPRLLRAADRLIKGVLGEGNPAETVLVIAGPGTSEADANAGIMKMARMIWEGIGFAWTEVGYLNATRPGIDAALSHAARLGYRRIVVFPYVLSNIGDDAVQQAVTRCRSENPDIAVDIVPALGCDPIVVDVLVERARDATGGGAPLAMNCQLCTYREQVLGLEEGAHHHGHDHDHDHGDGHHHGHRHHHHD